MVSETVSETDHRALEHHSEDEPHGARKGESNGKINGNSQQKVVIVTGDDLSIADLVAVARHRAPCRPTMDSEMWKRIDDSVDFLNQHLAEGHQIYGITTGFGGSADTRTENYIDLQKSLLQHQHAGVLLPSDIGQDPIEALGHLNSHKIARTAVRGAMLARCNSLMRGHSAVSRDVIGTIFKLINLDFIPVIPLRGSISASGDLSPLSYIAGVLEGNPGIYVDCRLEDGNRQIMNAKQALEKANIVPLTLGPKEGLGIMNGTAVSGAIAAIALHETNVLALLTQALTGMCTEALRGSVDNYHPFIAAARPHPGQIEAAANITRFLQGSSLSGSHESGSRAKGLYQDRYALRTSTQWIGPYIEDLRLAAAQLEIELNSTTDNPLIDVQGQRIHHGGNFQATSVTSAIEKTRLALQMFGKLLFAQSTEVINPMLNGNLPPNLSFDDPNTSFTFKGVDINMAAYMSELAFLANPVSSHVQTAEMNNQAVNSLALISTRYTDSAVELVSLMCAAHLYTLCQALDLQALHELQTGEKLDLPAARKAFLVGEDYRSKTEKLLSQGSKVLYRFVRYELGVGLHRGLVEHATHENEEVPVEERCLIGTQISKIYVAIRTGKIHGALVESMK